METIACCSSALDLGAGAGKYSELLEVAFNFVSAFDGTSGVAEITEGRVQYLNLGNTIEVGQDDLQKAFSESNGRGTYMKIKCKIK